MPAFLAAPRARGERLEAALQPTQQAVRRTELRLGLRPRLPARAGAGGAARGGRAPARRPPAWRQPAQQAARRAGLRLALRPPLPEPLDARVEIAACLDKAA